MLNRVAALAAAFILAAAPSASAQPVGVSGIFWWTLSDGVTGDAMLAADGNAKTK